MLMLLFYVGDERYAIDSRRVVEVLPLVALKKLHHAPEYVAGLFNYRGQILPVIDVSQLIQGSPCRNYLSTRIIMVNYFVSQENEPPRLLGLMAEKVTETLNKSENEFVAPGITLDAAPYLGKILTDEKGMIQYIYIDNLLPESQLVKFLPSV